MITIKDMMGTYEIPTNNPIDYDAANAIYINLFHNEGAINASEWKVGINVMRDNGSRDTYFAAMLNHFEPARWFRNIPVEYREKPFYRDFLHLRKEIKDQGIHCEVKPTAGFFYSAELGHDSPFNTAYAYMFMEKDAFPKVGIRFWDFTWFGDLEINQYRKGKGPLYTAVIKQRQSKGMIDGWS
jgi:hypothetical protein